MNHAPTRRHPGLAHDLGEPLLGVAAVDRDRQFEFAREFQMPPQRFLLRLSGRMHVMEIESAFPDRDDSLRARQLAQFANSIRVAILRIVRMHPDNRVDVLVTLCDFNRQSIGRDIRNSANRNNRADSGRPRAFWHAVQLAMQLRIREMTMGIDERVHSASILLHLYSLPYRRIEVTM